MNSFGASIFVPLLNVAKVLMPKFIPTDLSVLDQTSGWISTTKLKEYLLDISKNTQTLILTIFSGALAHLEDS